MVLFPAKIFLKFKEIIKYLNATIYYKTQCIIGIALELFVLNSAENFWAHWFQKLTYVNNKEIKFSCNHFYPNTLPIEIVFYQYELHNFPIDNMMKERIGDQGGFPLAQGMVSLTVGWVFLYQLMIRTVS